MTGTHACTSGYRVVAWFVVCGLSVCLFVSSFFGPESCLVVR